MCFFLFPFLIALLNFNCETLGCTSGSDRSSKPLNQKGTCYASFAGALTTGKPGTDWLRTSRLYHSEQKGQVKTPLAISFFFVFVFVFVFFFFLGGGVLFLSSDTEDRSPPHQCPVYHHTLSLSVALYCPIYADVCNSNDVAHILTQAFDSHTCYAAPPILDPFDPKTTFLYYAGGNGPHSGGGVEHGRANYMARATAATDGLAGLKSTVDGVAGKLHTAPLPLAKSSLSLRVSSDAVVNVRMETVDGELLLSGVAFSSAGATTSSSSSSSSTVSSSSSSESVDVAWSGGHAAAEAMVERLVESYAAAGSVGHVVLAMEVSGMLFSFTF